jgi:hypothetical protein
MTKSEIISLLTNPGIIAVVRAQKPEQVLPLSEALIAGGVIAIEITMTTPNAIATIREVSQKLGTRGLIGVGTVLDDATAREAIAAGAEFVVTPITRPEIVAAAHAADRPVSGRARSASGRERSPSGRARSARGAGTPESARATGPFADADGQSHAAVAIGALVGTGVGYAIGQNDTGGDGSRASRQGFRSRRGSSCPASE